jgi:hypothetical protein
MKKSNLTFVFSLILSFLLIPSLVFGQSYDIRPTVTTAPALPTYSNCVQLNRNFGLGSSDFTTGGEVSMLQNFLVSRGYGNFTGRGYFGLLTFQAVKNFQRANNVSPTGYVGPITRQRISFMTCGIIPVPQNVVITSISPASGPVGTQVAINGSGFTQNNRIRFASGGAVNVPSYNNGTLLYFTIPSYVGPCDWVGDTSPYRCLAPAQQVTPGNYQISVENQNGVSNFVTFVVTSANPPHAQPPVITGVSAPTTLTVNQTGTWTINAYDPQNSQLTYSVNWGDANNPPCSSITDGPCYSSDSAITHFQQSATFTHSYSQPGNYTAVFTVRNATGQTAKTSVSVQVTGYNPAVCADMNGDGVVTQADVDFIQNNSGMYPATLRYGDLNGNQYVNATDISIAKSQLGRYCSNNF